LRRTPLARLLSPASIAVIGGREAAEVARQCDRIGFSGVIWPVNPKRGEIEGRQCFRTVADLPAPPDAAFVAVPRDAAVAAIGELARIGCGGAVCYTSGFAEADAEGKRLEAEMVRASAEMALAGPNCYGFINALDGAALWPDQHGAKRVRRGVAIVTQSGNIGLNLTMQTRGLPLAYLVTVGNKAKGDFSSYIDALLDDERVSAIGLHVEGLDDIAAFTRSVSRARARRVPIVVVKAGRSRAGAELTMSHTSSLAGPDKLYDALFERLGVARAADLPVFIETLKLLHVAGPLNGRRLSSMSCSGGEASLMADLAESHGLETPPLADAARAKLTKLLGPRVNVANPLDYDTYIWGDLHATFDCFSAMLGAGYDMNALVLDFPRADRCDGASWETTLAAFEQARLLTGAPAAVISSLPEAMPESVAQRLVEAGITSFCGMSEALAAIGNAAAIGERWSQREAVAIAPARLLVGAGRMLDEAEAKSALASFGVVSPDRRIVDAQRAAGAAAEIGFPVVVKALSSTIAHKTEAGGVRLNLKTPQEVSDAVAAMASLSHTFLVERMIGGALAELIVGVVRDPQFGLALTLGAGGVLVELLADSATLLLPASGDDVERALQKLKVTRLLEGYRGAPHGDKAALVNAVLAVARYAEARQETLLELEVNPLLVLCDGRGAYAVDALIRLNEEKTV
jgi:acyl-CoA synthetase (NDP forming)